MVWKIDFNKYIFSIFFQYATVALADIGVSRARPPGDEIFLGFLKRLAPPHPAVNYASATDLVWKSTAWIMFTNTKQIIFCK